MTTSGTTTFSLTVAEFLDEAWERCGKDPAHLTARHIISARRSMNLLLADWYTDGHKQWKLDLQSQATTVGMASFTPATGTIDIFDMMLRRSGVDTPVVRISRDDYQQIGDKAIQGRPDRFFLDRGTTLTCFLWPTGENATDSLRYYRLARIQDVGAASNTLDLPVYWFEAFAAGVAAKLAEKWAPDKEVGLITKAAAAFKRAKQEDRDRADVSIQVSYG